MTIKKGRKTEKMTKENVSTGHKYAKFTHLTFGSYILFTSSFSNLKVLNFKFEANF